MPGTLRPATRGGWSTWWQAVSGGRPRYEASRTDDCDVARETRFYPSMVVRKTRDGEADRAKDPLALIADWDDAAPDTRQHGWVTRRRPRCVAATRRWRRRTPTTGTWCHPGSAGRRCTPM